MSRFNLLVKQIKWLIKGRLSLAVDEGMVVEPGVTVMSKVDFGSEPYLITLREGCRISTNVSFVTHDGGTWAFRNTWEEYKDVVKYGRIEVGRYSFIGARSIIMPGVTIGDNCVIGAGSVVTKDVPSGTVVAGVPARQICTTLEYAEKCKASMPASFDRDAYMRDKKSYLLGELEQRG